MHVQANLKALRVAVPYIRAFKGRVFVIKLGGQLCEPGRKLDNLVDQIALLHQIGIKVVVVHGGSTQANELSKRLGIETRTFAGRRITDGDTLEVAKMAFAGTANTDLVAAFRKANVPAIGMSGVDGGLVTVRRRPPVEMSDPSNGETREVDFGHVGDITAVNPEHLLHLLAGDVIPVICSLAADDDGNVMNVNADTIAARVAAEIGAAKYFLVTNVDGVLRDPTDPGTLQSYLDLGQLNELIEAGVISGGMLPKLAACVDALRGGVARVHIINGTVADTLLGEVFTNEGCGTLIELQKKAINGVTEKESVTA